MDMKRKQFAASIKAAPGGDPRVLRFFGSTEGVDRDGDTIDLEGWDVTDYMNNPVFLWAHDYSSPPIGKTVRIEKDRNSRALVFDVRFPTVAELSPDGPPSDHATFVESIYQMYKNGYLSATSVGFRATKMEPIANSYGQHILSASLMELSGCPVPANPEALIQARSFEGISAKAIDAIENAIKTERQKAGARLSSATMAALDKIDKCHAIIDKCNKEMMAAHSEATACLKELMGMEAEAPAEEPEADDDGDEKAVILIVDTEPTQER